MLQVWPHSAAGTSTSNFTREFASQDSCLLLYLLCSNPVNQSHSWNYCVLQYIALESSDAADFDGMERMDLHSRTSAKVCGMLGLE